MTKKLILVLISITISSNLVASLEADGEVAAQEREAKREAKKEETKEELLAHVNTLKEQDLAFFTADDAEKTQILKNTNTAVDAILNYLKSMLSSIRLLSTVTVDALTAAGNFSVSEKEEIIQEILQQLTDTLTNFVDDEFKKNVVDALYGPYFNIVEILDAVNQDYPDLQNIAANLKNILEEQDQPVQAAENGVIPEKVIQDIEEKIISTLRALVLSNIDFKDSDPQGQKQVIAQIKDDSQALIKLLSQLFGVVSDVPENDPSVTRVKNIFKQFLDELKDFEPEFKYNIMNITYPLLAVIYRDVEAQQPALVGILDQIMIEYDESLITNLSDTVDNYLKNLKAFNDGFAAEQSDAARQEILNVTEKIITSLTNDLTNLFSVTIFLASNDQKINTINNVFQTFLNQFKGYSQEFKAFIIDEMSDPIRELENQANKKQSPLIGVLMSILDEFAKEKQEQPGDDQYITNVSNQVKNRLKNIQDLDTQLLAAASEAEKKQIGQQISDSAQALATDFANLFNVIKSLPEADPKVDGTNEILIEFLQEFQNFNQDSRDIIMGEVLDTFSNLKDQSEQDQPALTLALNQILFEFTKDVPAVGDEGQPAIKPMSPEELLDHLNNLYLNLAALQNVLSK